MKQLVIILGNILAWFFTLRIAVPELMSSQTDLAILAVPILIFGTIYITYTCMKKWSKF